MTLVSGVLVRCDRRDSPHDHNTAWRGQSGVMGVYHLNCGSIYPYLPRVETIVYCLLVETDDGLVLVDTGFGLQDYTQPTRLMRLFTALMRTPRDPGETAVHQVAGLGFAPEDVRHIVCTHLHLDHAGGLPDFPWAKVHLYRLEYDAAMERRGFLGQLYRPEHWAHGPEWVPHDLGGGSWFDFACMPIAEALTPQILLVPLVGHTPGHCGVAVQTGSGWLFHCGDAVPPFYPAADPYHPGDVQPNWMARSLVGTHASSLQALVREHGDKVRLISGHDNVRFAQYRGSEAETGPV